MCLQYLHLQICKIVTFRTGTVVPPHWVSVDQVPAEEQKNKIREEKSKDATDKVCTMGNQNCGAATKAEKKAKCKTHGFNWPLNQCLGQPTSQW